tara:strand:+ start:416 stop:1045 length:630 start_codon:yes stop_codon:yes gene_type:complete
MSSYAESKNLDPKSPAINPLTYCIGNKLEIGFQHGGNADTYGQYSRACQLYVPEYCAQGWDAFCELMSRDTSRSYPTAYNFCQQNLTDCCNMTFGESLIYETASRKYLVNMYNGIKRYEPFDPTVPNSPMISYWTSPNQNLIPEYQVDPSSIDKDPVMNKILAKPQIAFNILINIYNTMKRKGTLHTLKNTKLGNFYRVNQYFISKGGI